MRFRCLLLPLLMFVAVLGVGLYSPSAQAGVWERYCRSQSGIQSGILAKEYRKHCGPVNWRWKLPPGNGHYLAPNPCLGPPAYYTPQLPLYYRGPLLRTIDMPIDEPLD